MGYFTDDNPVNREPPSFTAHQIEQARKSQEQGFSDTLSNAFIDYVWLIIPMAFAVCLLQRVRGPKPPKVY